GMRRWFVTSVCVALLAWAGLDDALAAQTPELDDDVTASVDNDCLQYAVVKVPTRAEARLISQAPFAADVDLARSPLPAIDSVRGPHLLCNPLYLFMSLQR